MTDVSPRVPASLPTIAGSIAPAPIVVAGPRRLPPEIALGVLALMLIAATIMAIGHGAYRIAPLEVLRILVDMVGIPAGVVDAQSRRFCIRSASLGSCWRC